jgi:hypothetical protein
VGGYWLLSSQIALNDTVGANRAYLQWATDGWPLGRQPFGINEGYTTSTVLTVLGAGMIVYLSAYQESGAARTTLAGQTMTMKWLGP